MITNYFNCMSAARRQHVCEAFGLRPGHDIPSCALHEPRKETAEKGVTVVFNSKAPELGMVILRRLRKNYFADNYATPNDLRDICAWGKKLMFSLADIDKVWENAYFRLFFVLDPWIRDFTPEGLLLAPVATEEQRRKILKNCRDYLLHSASADLLCSIHPKMVERAYQKSISALMRIERAYGVKDGD